MRWLAAGYSSKTLVAISVTKKGFWKRRIHQSFLSQALQVLISTSLTGVVLRDRTTAINSPCHLPASSEVSIVNCQSSSEAKKAAQYS